MKLPRFSAFFTALLAVVCFALPAMADDFKNTGSGVRTKTVAIITAKVYAIRHDMKEPLPPRSKQAVIDAEVDKRFSLQFMRDVDSEKIQKAFRESFALNGYGDAGKINQFVGAFSQKEVKEKTGVSISYNAANKSVTIWVQGGGSATIGGADFMKAVWSIWFGKIDQPSLGDALISNLK